MYWIIWKGIYISDCNFAGKSESRASDEMVSGPPAEESWKFTFEQEYSIIGELARYVVNVNL